MSEKRLWDYIFNNVAHLGHFSRVETHESSAGYPDVSFCIDGHVGHIELKYAKKGKPLRLRPSQGAWFRAQAKAGGVSAFLVFSYDEPNKRIFGIIPTGGVPELVLTTKIDDWLKVSIKIWHNKIQWDEFTDILQGNKK